MTSIAAAMGGFLIMIIVQSMFINGLSEAMRDGELLAPLKALGDKYIKSKSLQKMLYKCIKCMATIYSTIVYWPFVLIVFGFRWIEVLAYIVYIPAVSFVNFYFYKKI